MQTFGPSSLSNEELFTYRHALEQGSLHHSWIAEADVEIMRRGFIYINGQIFPTHNAEGKVLHYTDHDGSELDGLTTDECCKRGIRL